MSIEQHKKPELVLEFPLDGEYKFYRAWIKDLKEERDQLLEDDSNLWGPYVRNIVEVPQDIYDASDIIDGKFKLIISRLRHLHDNISFELSKALNDYENAMHEYHVWETDNWVCGVPKAYAMDIDGNPLEFIIDMPKEKQ